jgi:beta-glucosidase
MARPARETVQAYISDAVTSVTWADQELKAFTQVEIGPGQIVDVTINIAARDCSLVNARNQRLVEEGDFELRVGPTSQRDRQLTAPFHIRVPAPAP